MTDPQPIPVSPPPAPARGPATTRAPLILAAVLIVAAAMVVAYTLGTRSVTAPRAVESPTLPIRPEARPLAPVFTLPSLRGPERIGLVSFRGQVVVINFFASWCAPCALEAADLERTWRAYEGRGVVFLGVAIQDTADAARGFLAKHGITYQAVIDAEGDVMQAYQVTGIPTTVFVDANGRIVGRHAGTFVGDEGRARLSRRIEVASGVPR